MIVYMILIYLQVIRLIKLESKKFTKSFYLGGMSERPIEGGLVGATFACKLIKLFFFLSKKFIISL